MARLNFETYKNTVMSCGSYLHKTATEMTMESIFHFPCTRHDMPNFICVLICCANCPILFIPAKKKILFEQIHVQQ